MAFNSSLSLRLTRLHVTGGVKELRLHPEIEAWCKDSGLVWDFVVVESEDDPTHWGPGFGGDPTRAVLPLKGYLPYIRFQRETDLIAFKLRWF